MKKLNAALIIFLWASFSLSIDLVCQNGNSALKLQDLPIELSWDNFGVKIRVTSSNNILPQELLHLTPSVYLTKVGNDLIRVNSSAMNKQVIIDLTKYLGKESNALMKENGVKDSIQRVDISVPKISMPSDVELNSFALELSNFSTNRTTSKQMFIFKGLDVLYAFIDDCANLSLEKRTIKVDASNCGANSLILKGGLLDFENLGQKIPDLCRKYNSRFYIKREAFVCLEDCKEGNPDTEKNFRHVRDLITKYNITDYSDRAISFLDNIIITTKGIGINLKPAEKPNKANRKNKPIVYEAYDEYTFFPWTEFINLSFSKYADETQVQVENTYQQSYIYNSKIDFTNVELIHFFNELKALILSSTIN